MAPAAAAIRNALFHPLTYITQQHSDAKSLDLCWFHTRAFLINNKPTQDCRNLVTNDGSSGKRMEINFTSTKSSLRGLLRKTSPNIPNPLRRNRKTHLDPQLELLRYFQCGRKRVVKDCPQFTFQTRFHSTYTFTRYSKPSFRGILGSWLWITSKLVPAITATVLTRVCKDMRELKKTFPGTDSRFLQPWIFF